MVDFETWLKGELKKRDWKQADLCREANISSGALSTALERNRIGPDLARAIAKGLHLPQYVVFYHAGLMTELPVSNTRSERLRAIEYRTAALTEEEFAQLDRYIDFITEARREKRETKAKKQAT